ncbi:DNA repair protein RadA [Serinibacter salmoneus]|uniref:DNA repair protein RadA n=1 Tax=Serinibacter salmoneus TaxID=556530 RepID=A0A2A9D1E7_9MICO|nr:DNA repair protein RadA [Serinibacter salmoneus]PFG20538.1 DNA repair protein RadA/Sms [Serinibacter salmoneus]
MATRSTARSGPTWRCTECGASSAKWVGRCTQCRAWGTVEEQSAPVAAAVPVTRPTAQARPIAQVDADVVATRATGIGELDRVLGGGIVPGAVTLLAGEPGVGKSTLLLAAAAAVAQRGVRVLYLTGEESAAQVRLRAQRIGALHPDLLLAAESDLGGVLGHIEDVQPGLLVLDSVQTIASAQVEGSAGGVAQVRQVTAAVIAEAKRRHLPVILVGHVTKDGGIAGPRVLEHLVDVVCVFEGDRHSRLRMMRAVKNRYGPTDEVGCFDLTDSGITGLADPSGLFLSERGPVEPGTCVSIALDGARAMPIEIQALIATTTAPHPRRATSGVDASRVSMALAVMESRLGVSTASQDVYVSTIGGAKVVEPAADTALALAVLSARTGRPVGEGTVAIGEVSLTGQLRPTTGLERRLAEAARLGFGTAVVPHSAGENLRIGSMRILRARDLREAAEFALVAPPQEGITGAHPNSPVDSPSGRGPHGVRSTEHDRHGSNLAPVEF